MKITQVIVLSAIGDLPQNATEGKEGISNDQRGFSAIKVTQFAILPKNVSVSYFESVF